MANTIAEWLSSAEYLLSGGNEKVNSDVSDSIFSARRLMISSFVPEIDDKIWAPSNS